MKNKKNSKNLIWLVIQLINVVFQIIRAITNTDGKEFFDDLQEIIDSVNPNCDRNEVSKENEADPATSEESC